MLKSTRPKRSAIGVVLVLALFGLAACSAPSNAPSDYDALTESNFMDGCTAVSPPPDTTSLGTGASQAYCQCAYNWFVDNVPYDTGNPETFDGTTFKSLSSKLGDSPADMPEAIQTGLANDCGTSAEPKDPPTTTPTTVGAEASQTTTTSVAG